jgi:branched-chain amino acid transport system substrate-binding protein
VIGSQTGIANIVSNQENIKVGLLFSASGVISTIGHSQLQGALFAIDEINKRGGVGGRMIEPIIYDAKSEPAEYARLAERLFARDGVNVVFGCYMSSSRKMVIPVVEKWNRLLFYPTLYEGFEFSANVIYTGAAPNQNSVQLAEFMLANFGPRVYLVGSNYIYPYESNRIMRELVQQHRGGEVVAERYLPLSAGMEDFQAIARDLKDKRPDFIFSTVVGDSTSLLYQAFAEAGLQAREMPIASLTTSEAEVARMGFDVAAGHFTAAPYFQSISSEVNRRCLDKYFNEFKGTCVPNMCWEASYFQVHIFANALERAGCDQIDVLLPEILGSEFDAPQGRVRIEPSTHHTCLYPRVGRVNSKGQFTVVREARRAVVPDPYLVTHSLGDWSARIEELEG